MSHTIIESEYMYTQFVRDTFRYTHAKVNGLAECANDVTHLRNNHMWSLQHRHDVMILSPNKPGS